MDMSRPSLEPLPQGAQTQIEGIIARQREQENETQALKAECVQLNVTINGLKSKQMKLLRDVENQTRTHVDALIPLMPP